jgi:hypothetical protein
MRPKQSEIACFQSNSVATAKNNLFDVLHTKEQHFLCGIAGMSLRFNRRLCCPIHAAIGFSAGLCYNTHAALTKTKEMAYEHRKSNQGVSVEKIRHPGGHG